MASQLIGIQRVLQTRGAGQTWNNKLIRWSILHNHLNISKPYQIELQMVLLSSKRIVKVNNQVKDIQMWYLFVQYSSFGYNSKFSIADDLNGEIKQDSLSFQLFVNGHSFTHLQQMNKTYEPPKLNFNKSDNFFEERKNLDSAKNINTAKNQTKNQSKLVGKEETKIQNSSHKLSTQTKLKQATKNQKSFNNIGPSMKDNYQEITEGNHLKDERKTQKEGQGNIDKKWGSNKIEEKESKKGTQNCIKDTQNELMRILMQEKKKKLKQNK